MGHGLCSEREDANCRFPFAGLQTRAHIGSLVAVARLNEAGLVVRLVVMTFVSGKGMKMPKKLRGRQREKERPKGNVTQILCASRAC